MARDDTNVPPALSAISIGIPINTASLPSCARQTQQISATVSTTMCSKFISNSRIFAIVMIGVLLLFCSASIYISWGQRLHLTSRGRIEDWARDVCGENRNANQYLMPFSFRLKAQDSTLTGLKPWEGQRPWEGTGWTMLLGKDDTVNLCAWKRINTWLRITGASVSLADGLYCLFLVLMGLRETLHSHNTIHSKLTIAWAIMSLLDFSDFYTGWESCYTDQIINVDRRMVEECLYWPWLPTLIIDGLLIFCQLAMESVFEHYRTEVMTTRLRRARTKQAAEYEQAALQDLEQKVNDE